MPWGNVAGKWYGPDDVRPIVCLHGWQDNAGTFNTLIPLLPKLSYLAIDLPGHGLSSHLPPGMFYSAMNYIHTLNHIQRYYNWNQVSFCSHSMGAQISQLYASLYPDRCDLLICFDALMKPYTKSMDKLIEYIQKTGSEFLLLDQLNQSDREPPTYTHEQIIDRWIKQTNMTQHAVENLMERGVFQSRNDPNRFYFSRDIRLKLMEFAHTTIPENVQYKLMERITAPFLFIKANKTGKFIKRDVYQKIFDIFTAFNPKFEWIEVLGGHHCHLSHPTVVSDHVSNFISKHRLP